MHINENNKIRTKSMLREHIKLKVSEVFKNNASHCSNQMISDYFWSAWLLGTVSALREHMKLKISELFKNNVSDCSNHVISDNRCCALLVEPSGLISKLSAANSPYV